MADDATVVRAGIIALYLSHYSARLVHENTTFSMTTKQLRYFLEIAYQGMAYHGWQIQQNALTVQGVIQASIAKVLSSKVPIIGSSRTDTGVHATQQVAHLDVACSVNPNKLHYQLNAVLPHTIAIKSIHRVTSQAHARFDALSRTYEYRIIATKNPFLNDRSYFYSRSLDVEKMNQAAAILLGKNNFKSFSNVKVAVNNFLCNVKEAIWIRQGAQLVFRITANRFLRGMVRAIVGTLLKVGQSKVSVSGFETIIDQQNRCAAANAVPAQGLCLTKVVYPKPIFVE